MQDNDIIRNNKGLIVLAFTAFMILGGAEPSHATILDNFGEAVLEILNNNFLRTIAIIAVIISGIMALRGRVPWESFVSILVAIVIIFGAGAIVDYIKDNSEISYQSLPIMQENRSEIA